MTPTIIHRFHPVSFSIYHMAPLLPFLYSFSPFNALTPPQDPLKCPNTPVPTPYPIPPTTDTDYPTHQLESSNYQQKTLLLWVF